MESKQRFLEKIFFSWFSNHIIFRLYPWLIHKRPFYFHKWRILLQFKFDVPIYLGNGNHDPQLFPKSH